MREIEAAFFERLKHGLVRKSLNKCSRWSETYRVLPNGPWTFRNHPWLREMMDADNPMCVGQKAAQMGYTECVLNRTFYKIDIEGIDCLYVLPAKSPDASDFSAARFDPALELSPHLAKMFSDVKNVGHKRAGSANLYIRGSRSRAGLKSIPAGFIVMDERDEMTQENVPLAMERMSGQFIKQVWQLSTPTVEDYGINIDFKQSTQDHFFFKCPRCSRSTELVYPDCLVVTADNFYDPKVNESHLICKECKGVLPHEQKPDFLEKAFWVPSRTDTDVRGFYINQMYSPTVTPVEIAKSAIRARNSAADEQELYNSKLGMPHSPEGARVVDSQIKNCMKEYKKYSTAPNYGIVCMGVDVGKFLHTEIGTYSMPQQFTSLTDLNSQCNYRLLNELKVTEFEELDRLMLQYGVNMCVIDIHPERRKAYEFACRFFGRVRMCMYPEGLSTRQISENANEMTVSVDRTSWLDISLGRFRAKTIELPVDLSTEYKEHIKAQVRIFKKDQNGNQVARYVTGSSADHFGHARNYCEIALPLAASMAQVTTIRA